MPTGPLPGVIACCCDTNECWSCGTLPTGIELSHVTSSDICCQTTLGTVAFVEETCSFDTEILGMSVYSTAIPANWTIGTAPDCVGYQCTEEIPTTNVTFPGDSNSWISECFTFYGPFNDPGGEDPGSCRYNAILLRKIVVDGYIDDVLGVPKIFVDIYYHYFAYYRQVNVSVNCSESYGEFVLKDHYELAVNCADLETAIPFVARTIHSPLGAFFPDQELTIDHIRWASHSTGFTYDQHQQYDFCDPASVNLVT